MTTGTTWARYALDDEVAWCAGDPRLSLDRLDLGGTPPATVLVRADGLDRLGPAWCRQRGLDPVPGPVLLVGGAGGSARFALEGAPDDPDVADLVRAAGRVAEAEGRAVAMVYVPTSLLPVVTSALPALRPGRSSVRSVLDLLGGDWDAVLDGLDRHARQTWRRDERDAAALGLTTTVGPTTAADVAEGAPYVAAVAAANDEPGPPALVRLVLGGWLRTPGEHLVVRTRRGDRTVGLTFCRRVGDVLDVHTVGLDPGLSPGDPTRRETYHAAAYLAPARLAVELGAKAVDFGIGHPDPKRNRGCRTDELWSLQ